MLPFEATVLLLARDKTAEDVVVWFWYIASIAMVEEVGNPCDAAVPTLVGTVDVAIVELLMYTASLAMLVDELKPCEAAVPNADDTAELLIVLDEAVAGATLSEDVEF